MRLDNNVIDSKGPLYVEKKLNYHDQFDKVRSMMKSR